MKKQIILKALSALPLCFCLMPMGVSAGENYSERPEVKQFINEMHTEHGYSKEVIRAWMKDVKQQKTALEAIARPAEGVLTWKKYRKIFLTDKRINKGVQFWEKNAAFLSRAEKEFGVSAEFIVAIIGVETFYGKRAGNYPVLDALITLGFDYPPRSAFFRKQLKQYMLMVREEKLDARELTGSYAGAMGMPQFIPSSFRSFAVDFDGNGVRDFWNSSADSIGSVANYFNKHGWVSGEPVISRAQVNDGAKKMASKKMKPHKLVIDYKRQGVKPVKPFKDRVQATLLKLDGADGEEYWLGLNNFYVITRYNHSPLYAMAVYQLSQAISTKYNAQINVN
ncbi:Membrane-bound lytic murein transglycosylase B [hydrothermal vent metagenome]|uniref:Membrane-bound lytic murein transglycosylase B n=1 Tax=hydrothermal vent metagenome TaxID=652676 RepID=A0A3B0XJ76_9ZZZZ